MIEPSRWIISGRVFVSGYPQITQITQNETLASGSGHSSDLTVSS